MQKLYTYNAPEMVGRKILFFKYARKEVIHLTTIDSNFLDIKKR